MSTTTPSEIVNFRTYRDNPYQALLFTGIEDRYIPVAGSVQDAIDRQRRDATRVQILHLHWEEAVIRRAPTQAEALIAVDSFILQLDRLRAMGGRILWTIHNLAPHENEHPAAFARLRAGLFARADRILIHSTTTIAHLTAGYDVDVSRFFLLPHPSYIGTYPAAYASGETPATEQSPTAEQARLLIFGQIRRYKAVDRFIDLFGRSPLADAGHRLDIHGKTQIDDTYDAELRALAAELPGIDLHLGYVPDADIADIFAGATALLLPYERFLTSGALMLAMTHGLPIIAPDVPQLREVLPTALHRYLYPDGQPEQALSRAETLIALPPQERKALREALLARAAHYAPSRISGILADLYDEVAV